MQVLVSRKKKLNIAEDHNTVFDEISDDTQTA